MKEFRLLTRVIAVLSICIWCTSARAQIGVFDMQVDWEVGNFKLPGSIEVTGTGDEAVYTIIGNGDGLGASGGSDEAFYVYSDQTGSWSLQGRVMWDDPTGVPFGTVGLMIRENAVENNSRHFSLVLRADELGDHTDSFFRNLIGVIGEQGAELTSENGEPIFDQGDGLWLRVSFIQPFQTFVNEYSFDGENWVIGDVQVFPWNAETLSYGLVASNDEDNDFVAQAQFSNVSFQPAPPIAIRTASKPTFVADESLEISIEVFNPGDPTDLTISETLPAGWLASNISNGGSSSAGVVTWNLTSVTQGSTTLTYQATAPSAPESLAEWSGTIVDGLTTQGKTGLLLSGGNVSRISDGLLALYTFDEGGGEFVTDVSEVGEPLDLFIEDTSAITWGQGFINKHGPTKIRSEIPAFKLFDGITVTNEMTVEAWVTPANLTQAGPARIVTYSGSAGTRNFTLGQTGNFWAVRLRTPITGNNGFPMQLETPPNTVTTILTHIAYTRDDFWESKFYVNGEVVVDESNFLDLHGYLIDGDLSNWDETFELGLADELNDGRPWLGEMHLAAIYDRAITEDEIVQNYAAGPSAGPGTNVLDWSLY